MKYANAKNAQTLILDLGGVLLNLNRDRCVENFRRLGFVNAGEFIDLKYQRGIFSQFDGGEISRAEFFELVRIKSARKDLSDKEIEHAWCSIIDGFARYKFDFVSKLKQKRKVLLLSNVNELVWEMCLREYFAEGKYEISKMFENTYLSYKLRLLKPSKEIFEYLIEDANLEPSECFFIDDSDANCKTAVSLGISSYCPKPRENWTKIFL